MKEAKRMLAQCDITEEHREWMAINPRMLGIDLSAGDIAEEDVFFAFRGYRMNYYAITAILARVYFWNGEYELAYNEAKRYWMLLMTMMAKSVFLLWNIWNWEIT